ncbi:efflux RND transporter periplasmic adaptor subunit [Brumimicrobium aurantiacum]|uniref:Efflux RND transporter periplasmic adaptor subunit n=1 Tax=Brumimicrobium aurantiacum TaxID=1737063 RepID=A0A3E1EVG9_9FLAO|nr:efflux RND transporter periplasmic adaptor subunit [Brumimicrobium aurantiacum]RFC53540.1 efflux RND transporter periplasmic adaptor subunit [Brumimicrobium aurantiacum]
MRKYFKSLIVLGIITSVVACSPNAKLDKLKEKRAELKVELAELDTQIKSMDTAKVVMLPYVESGKAEFGQFKHKITIQGDIETDKQAMIIAEANGLIKSINVVEGQSVSKGQILARIDTEILASNIKELETQLEFAEYNLEKQQQLFDRGVGTEFELKQAKNQKQSLSSQLNTIKTQSSKSVVRAPYAGVVDEIVTHEGEMASAQSPILRLVNNKDMYVSGNISEHYYKTIKEGTDVEVYVPTLEDTFVLQVSSIGNYIHPTNRTFKVKADIKDETQLLPNMLAEMNITDLVVDSALIVPSVALLKTQQNEDYIFILEKSGENYIAKQVMVNIVSQFEGKAAIDVENEVIKKGDRVVSAGARGITDGDIVRIEKR